MEDEIEQSIDRRLIVAISHPVRAKILTLLVNAKELSAGSIATKLGVKPGNVGYHLSVLRQCEAVEVARIEQHRGAAESFFRPAPDSLAGGMTWQQLPAAVRSDISAVMLESFLSRIAEIEPRGGL